MAEYTVTVEDCTSGVGDDGNSDDQYGQDVEINNIINIPEKDLPKTGGPPLLGVLFVVVAGTGLLTAVVRRKRTKGRFWLRGG